MANKSEKKSPPPLQYVGPHFEEALYNPFTAHQGQIMNQNIQNINVFSFLQPHLTAWDNTPLQLTMKPSRRLYRQFPQPQPQHPLPPPHLTRQPQPRQLPLLQPTPQIQNHFLGSDPLVKDLSKNDDKFKKPTLTPLSSSLSKKFPAPSSVSIASRSLGYAFNNLVGPYDYQRSNQNLIQHQFLASQHQQRLQQHQSVPLLEQQRRQQFHQQQLKINPTRNFDNWTMLSNSVRQQLQQTHGLYTPKTQQQYQEEQRPNFNIHPQQQVGTCAIRKKVGRPRLPEEMKLKNKNKLKIKRQLQQNKSQQHKQQQHLSTYPRNLTSKVSGKMSVLLHPQTDLSQPTTDNCNKKYKIQQKRGGNLILKNKLSPINIAKRRIANGKFGALNCLKHLWMSSRKRKSATKLKKPTVAGTATATISYLPLVDLQQNLNKFKNNTLEEVDCENKATKIVDINILNCTNTKLKKVETMVYSPNAASLSAQSHQKTITNSNQHNYLTSHNLNIINKRKSRDSYPTMKKKKMDHYVPPKTTCTLSIPPDSMNLNIVASHISTTDNTESSNINNSKYPTYSINSSLPVKKRKRHLEETVTENKEDNGNKKLKNDNNHTNNLNNSGNSNINSESSCNNSKGNNLNATPIDDKRSKMISLLESIQWPTNVTSDEMKLDFIIDKPDQDGNIPLHLAVLKNDVPCTSALVQQMGLKNMSLDRYNKDKKTPLHLAIEKENLSIIFILIQGSASCNVPDSSGKTACHLAIEKNNTDILKVLCLYSGVPIVAEIRNKEGLTLFEVARLKGTDIHALLKELLAENRRIVVTKNRLAAAVLEHNKLSGKFGPTNFMYPTMYGALHEPRSARPRPSSSLSYQGPSSVGRGSFGPELSSRDGVITGEAVSSRRSESDAVIGVKSCGQIGALLKGFKEPVVGGSQRQQFDQQHRQHQHLHQQHHQHLHQQQQQHQQPQQQFDEQQQQSQQHLHLQQQHQQQHQQQQLQKQFDQRQQHQLQHQQQHQQQQQSQQHQQQSQQQQPQQQQFDQHQQPQQQHQQQHQQQQKQQQQQQQRQQHPHSSRTPPESNPPPPPSTSSSSSSLPPSPPSSPSPYPQSTHLTRPICPKPPSSPQPSLLHSTTSSLPPRLPPPPSPPPPPSLIKGIPMLLPIPLSSSMTSSSPPSSPESPDIDRIIMVYSGVDRSLIPC